MKKIGLLLLLLLARPLTLTAATLTVANNNDAGAGSLRQAIADASSNDTITFDSGLNSQTIRLTSGALSVEKNLTFDADNLSNGITLDAGGNSRIIFSSLSVALEFHHISFLNGNADTGNGGAIYLGGANTSIKAYDCYFENNFAQRGGAIYRLTASPTFSLRLERSTFRGNTAFLTGGAMDARGGALTVERCTLVDNIVGLNSSGVRNTDTANGGALYLGPNVRGRILTSTFTGNRSQAAFSNGGAVFKDAGSTGFLVEIETCTVVGNLARIGGGLYCDSSGAPGLTLKESCVALNQALLFDQDLHGDYGIFSTFNFIGIPGSATNIGLVGSGAPLLSPLGDFGGPTLTMMPLAGSPLIDGISYTQSDADQRQTETSAGFVKNDIGAIESGAAIVVNTLLDETTDASTTSLREALAAAALTVPASRITFDAAVFDGNDCFPSEIELTQGPLLPPALQSTGANPRSYPGIFIDGSSVDAPVVLRAGPSQAIAVLSSDTTLAAHQLTLTGGGGSSGGAIRITSNASLSLSDCTLKGNASSNGGAINNDGGAFLLHRCTLHGNQTSNDGGAVYNNSQRSRLGRIGVLSLCTLEGNLSTTGASAIHNQDGLLEIRHCTITDNRTPSVGAVASYGDAFTETVVQRSIVSGNTGGDLNLIGSSSANSFTTFDYNLIGLRGSGGTSDPLPAFVATGDTTGDTNPQLAPLAHYGGHTWTRPALINSAAIAPTGSPRFRSPLGDQRGGQVISPFGTANRTDSGSVQSPVPLRVTNANDDGTGSLRTAITQARTFSGAHIHFDPAVFDGQAEDKIQLLSPLFVNGAGFTLIDASGLSQKVEIGTGSFFAFEVSPSPSGPSVVSFHHLALDGALTNQSGGITSSGTIVVDRCKIERMTASLGSAISNSERATIHGSTFAFNQTENRGTVYNQNVFVTVNSVLRVAQSTFYENSDNAAFGGGTLFSGGCLMLENSTFAHNRSRSGGAGIRLDSGAARLRNCTISRNVGGIDFAVGGISINSAAVRMDNCIVAGNSARAGAAPDLIGSPDGANNVVGTEPLLLPLGNYGGPVQTMPPLSASPAIDLGLSADLSASLVIDQRGYPRTIGALDAGAVEAQPALMVSSAGDSGAGTLREKLTGPLIPGQRITFDPVLFDSDNAPTISLVSAISFTGTDIIVDASLQPCNVRIDLSSAPSAARAFDHTANSSAVLHGLDLTGGTATGNGGGVISNSGRLTLVDCYLYQNESNQGGAVVSFDELILQNCTFAHNSASGLGGAILQFNNATLIAKSCTFTENAADNGGAISANSGSVLDFSFCTFTGNTGTTGGILAFGSPQLFALNDSILTGNSGAQSSGIFTGSFNLLTGDPLLVPLANYGGRTPSRPPSPDSPALDSGTLREVTTTIVDQRGAPRVIDGTATFNVPGITDAGAVEYQPHVVTSRSDSGFGTLREAVEAPFGSTIIFSGSAFMVTTPNIRLTSGALKMDRSKYIIDASTLLIPPLILDGTNNSRVLEIGPKADVTLKGVELVRGRINDHGGAIYNQGTLLLEDCVLEDNGITTGSVPILPDTHGHNGYHGGAIYSATNSSVTLQGCRLNENFAGDGGDGHPTSITDGGDGGSGGAIFAQDCAVTIRDSYLHDNRAGMGGQAGTGGGVPGAAGGAGIGGGIAVLDSSLLVQRSTLAANTSGSVGGGVGLVGGTNTFVATTLTANQAPGGGAGYCVFGDLDFYSCTISGNTAGGGSSSGIFSDGFGTVRFANSIIAGNSTGIDLETSASPNPFVSLGYNLYGNDNGTSTFGAVGDTQTFDPFLTPLAFYGGDTPTMHPLIGSPAIDQGGNLLGPEGTTDQRGFSRPFEGVAEIGAVEVPKITAEFLTDIDNNGMADQLEGGEGLFPRCVTDPDYPVDSDGDGFTDAQEIELGTNPFDASSLMQISSIVINETSVTIQHTAFPGLDYAIDQDPSLDFSQNERFRFSKSTEALQTETLLRSPGSPTYFYRVVRE